MVMMPPDVTCAPVFITMVSAVRLTGPFAEAVSPAMTIRASAFR